MFRLITIKHCGNFMNQIFNLCRMSSLIYEKRCCEKSLLKLMPKYYAKGDKLWRFKISNYRFMIKRKARRYWSKKKIPQADRELLGFQVLYQFKKRKDTEYKDWIQFTLYSKDLWCVIGFPWTCFWII